MFTRHNQVALLGIPGKGRSVYDYGAITLYGITFQRLSSSPTRPNPGSTHHISAAFSTADSVWPIPLSLAASYGITIVFFSCAY